MATPVLFTAIDIYKRLQTPSSLQVPMLLVGTFAIALGCVSVFLAWPAPLLMIGAGVGLLVMLAAAGALLQRGGLIYPASLVVSFLLVLAWFGFKGQLDWMNRSSEVLILRLMTPTTGFIWVGYSLVCAAVAIVLGKIGKLNGSIGLMQSALMSGGLGTILLTAFGFGREAYATSLGATYFVYAIAAMTFASIRRNPWLEIVAVAFMVSASFQWIIIGWTGFEWWDRLYASVFALTLALLVGMVVQRVLGFETASDRPISTACFFSLCVFTSLAVTRSISHEPLLAASLLWFVFTWLQKENLYWTITQFVASSALVGGVIRSCIDASWWPNQAANQLIGFVHPIFIQYLALSLFITGIVLIVFDAALKRLSNSIGLAILGPLKQIHDASVARVLIGIGSVLTLCVMLYGAIPGLSQEIIPIDALTSTELSPMKRSIPDLRSLELNGVPHAAAAWGRDSGSFRVWGLPPILASWGIGLISLLCACWNLRKNGSNAWGSWAGLLAAFLISIWYPFATLAEPSIAVASTLRWLTAGVLFLACLILSFWIQRMDRTQVFVAKEQGELFDKLLRVISIQSLSPWLLMGATAIGMIMLQFKNVPGFTSLGNGFIWVVALFMAFAALVFMMLPRLSKSETADQQASLWGIVASTLLITPLLAWTMLSVAVTVIDHPLTGPDPGTFFHKLGLAASYSIPIFLIACGLISAAAARPSPRLAFIAALFLMASIAAGYLLVLKSRGVHVESWIGLCAIVSISGSVYGLVWKWMVAMDHRPDDWLQNAVPPIPQVRNNLQTALSHISAVFAIVGLAMIVYQILIPRTSSSGLVWCSAGIMTALLFHFFQSVKGDSGLKLSPWIATGGAACMGVIAPNFSTSTSALGASGLVILLAGFLAALLSFRIDAVTNRRTNPRFAIWFVLALATCIGFRAFFDASPLATTTRSIEELAPVAILAAAWALSAWITWIHSDRWTWFLSFLILQSTGLFFSILNAASMNSSEFAWTAGLFIQIALAAISSIFATMCGFGRKSRVPLVLGTFALFTMSMIWLLMVFAFGASSTAWSSGANSDLPTFHLPWYAVAIIACLIGGFTGFWNLRSKDEHTVVYLAGLSSTIWLIQYSGATGPMFYWLSTIILAAYCLAASFLWVSGERIQQELSALLRIPRAAEKPSSMMVVPINTLLAFAVVSLGVMSLFVQESQNFRFISANAIMAAAFAVGFLSQHASIRGSATPMRVLALSIGVVYAIALFWHVQPPKTPLAFRFAVVPLPVVLTAAVYGFGLIKWFGSKKGWEQAGMILVPWIVSLAIIIGATTVFLETQLPSLTVRATADLYSPICLVLSLLIAIVLSIGAAILPGKDPLGLSQKGKEAYVYGAQAIVVLLIVHLRITMPFLFSGWLQSIWPLLVVAIGFAGVGLSQWSERRGLTVLANPLLNSGSLLPLLPVLAPWIAPSNVDQGATMLMSAVGYGMFGYYRASPIYITASILCANIAFWQLLSKNQFSFVEHPQLWVIPPALCVFAAGQFFKDRLTPTQLASIRYASVGSIYVASTSELFLQGIAKAPWLPIVLAFLSVMGIIFGVAARIRSMLWLGSMFLAVAMFSILWYAAVDLNQTWLWYVCGIVLGAVMLFVFAMFEKRREELKRLMSNVQQWEE
ncbi:MAG: hypothetical protein ACKOAU_09305 [Pirellula sp.]